MNGVPRPLRFSAILLRAPLALLTVIVSATCGIIFLYSLAGIKFSQIRGTEGKMLAIILGAVLLLGAFYWLVVKSIFQITAGIIFRLQKGTATAKEAQYSIAISLLAYAAIGFIYYVWNPL